MRRKGDRERESEGGDIKGREGEGERKGRWRERMRGGREMRKEGENNKKV